MSQMTCYSAVYHFYFFKSLKYFSFFNKIYYFLREIAVKNEIN